MNIDITFLGIIGGVLSIGLGTYIFLFNPRKNINRSLALYSVLTGIWAFALYFYVNPIWFGSETWIKIVYLIIIPLLLPVIHFSYFFPQKDSFSKRYKAHLAIYFIVGLICAYYLFFTNLWVVKVQSGLHGPETILGPAYILWGVYMFVNFVFIMYPFWVRYKKAKGLEKGQIQYIAVGFLIMALSGMMLDVFIPLLFKTTRYFWASSLFAFALAIFTSYAIIRYRLIDIRLAFRAIVLSVISAGIVAAIFTVLLAFPSRAYYKNFTFSTATLFFFAAFILVLVVRPALKTIRVIFDRLLFQQEYSEQELIRTIGKTMMENIELEILLKQLQEILTKVLKAENVDFLLTRSAHMRDSDSIMRAAKFWRKIVLRDEIKRQLEVEKDKMLREEMRRLNRILDQSSIEVVVPLFAKKDVIGAILLGEKKSNEPYSTNDIQVLESLMYQAGTAIENARLYSEVKTFSQKLQKEVEKATRDLKDSNKKLLKVNERLRELDHLKDAFVPIASQELKTPLTAIKNYLWMLKEGKEKSELDQKGKEFLEKVVKLTQELFEQVEKLGKIVDRKSNLKPID